MKSYLKKIVIFAFERVRKISIDHYYLTLREKYTIDKSFRFNGCGIKFFGDGEIEIRSNTYLGENSYIQSVKGESVFIGKNCALSHNIRIYTSSYMSDQDFNIESNKESYSGSVRIGNGVWIGANVLINPGIQIGDNVVIGANSVVTKNIEANGIYGGVPAKLIRFKKVV